MHGALSTPRPHAEGPSPPLHGRSHVYSEATVTELGPDDVNRYYGLTPERIPEAFLPFYAEAAKRRESVTDKGGCKGLRVRSSDMLFGCAASLRHATAVMWRQA